MLTVADKVMLIKVEDSIGRTAATGGSVVPVDITALRLVLRLARERIANAPYAIVDAPVRVDPPIVIIRSEDDMPVVVSSPPVEPTKPRRKRGRSHA